MLYSDILNNLIGDYWLRSIFADVLRGKDEGNLDEIMPIPQMQSEGHRQRVPTLMGRRRLSVI